MKWAVITGASSGLGEEFAWQVARAGFNPVLVARRRERLADLAAKIEASLGVQTEVLVADLGSEEGLAAVSARLRQGERPVQLLVNNAGMALGQSFVGGDLAREEVALNVMVKAVMVLSHVMVSEFIARAGAGAVGAGGAAGTSGETGAAGNGRSGGKAFDWRAIKGARGAIINVSSATAGTAMGTYASHKTWVRAFSESLASELTGSHIAVTALCPGLVATEFHSAAGMNESVWPRFAFLPRAEVVRQALAANRRGQVICIPSWRYRAIMAVVHHAPRALVRRVAGSRLFDRAL